MSSPRYDAKKPARILVVDDHPIVRAGLAAQIANCPHLELCGEAEDVAEGLAGALAHDPDLVIVDISLKNGNGIELVKRLKARDEAVRILVWSMYPENLYAERALRAGAQGYVHKSRATTQIVDAIEAVLAGKVYVCEELSSRLLSRVVGGNTTTDVSPIDSLTDRELEAFELLGQGMTTQQIAKEMHVSPKTVETYRAHIKEKLNLSNATELIQRAAQWVAEKNR